MNLPNKLTVARIFMIPGVIALIMLADAPIPRIIAFPAAAVLFSLVSLTDYYDGKIARERNLVTSLGKFLDPLADKLLVIGTMLCILYKFDAIKLYFFWAVLVVIFRELMVTGLRLVAVSEGGEVIAANRLGKIKTVTQIVCIIAVLIEPAIEALIEKIIGGEYVLHGIYPLSIITTAAMTFFTVWSGLVYILTYKNYLKQ